MVIISEDRSDVDVLEACWRGDVQGFAAIYDRHAPAVMRYAWARLGDRSEAEEILQETFLTAWAKRRQATIVDLSLLPWILAIAGNHIRNQLRRRARTSTLTLHDLPEPAAPQRDGLVAIEQAMATLSELDRRVCELCLIDGYSYKQAAERVELTEVAVSKRLQRARAHLRNELTLDQEAGRS